MINNIHLVGYGFGYCAKHLGCSSGPSHLAKSNILSQSILKIHWHAFLETEHNGNENETLNAVAAISGELATSISGLVQQNKLFATIGGGHSSGIGTWSGAATAKAAQGPIGLVWIDAHMDAHTFETTPSNNIHGMPVAVLLGHGVDELVKIASPQPKIRPEHLCLVGVRDYEDGESALLESLNVRVIKIEEVHQRGIEDCMQEACDIANRASAGFGISIDLDGFDPKYAPGVGTPVPNGIDVEGFCRSLDHIPRESLIGIEIVEFNPDFDKDDKTLQLFNPLLEACFAHTL